MIGDAKDLFRDGVHAIDDNNDIAGGRKLLVQSLRLNPDNDAAWLWLARTVSDLSKQRECVNRALSVNPQNAQAQSLLEQLNERESIAIHDMQPLVATSSAIESSRLARKPRGELGKLVISDRVSFWSQSPKLLVVVILALWIMVILDPFLNTPGGPGTIPALIIFIGIPAAIALYSLYSFIQGRKKRIEIHKGGIALISGGKSKTWLWDDFSALKLTQNIIRTHYRVYGVIPVGSSTSTKFHADFFDAKGKRLLSLGKSFPNYFKLGTAIVERFGPVVLERDLAAFRRGNTVQYDNISVDRNGIRRKSFFSTSTLPWNEIRQWQFQNGTLVIQKRDGKQSVYTVNGVTNGFALVLLMGEIQAERHVRG